jgi:hypothetical protein
MSDALVEPEEIDRRLSWPPGRAARLAKQRRLPHILLPDGAVRFEWPVIERLLVKVPAPVEEVPNAQ